MDPSDWESQPLGHRDPSAAPLLAVAGFEGPLDWLVELARERRIDLQRLSVLALVEAFEAALREALDGEASAASLSRWAGWTVLAAELTVLRSRLLLADVDAASARDEAEALRRRLLGRAEMAAAAAWLDGRVQLGQAVFARGFSETSRATLPGRTGDVTALLRACLVALAVPEDLAAAFRVMLPLWTAADAVARIRGLLAELDGAWTPFSRLLPQIAADAPQRERRCRAAVASTFVAALELARQDELVITQSEPLPSIRIARRTPITTRAALRPR